MTDNEKRAHDIAIALLPQAMTESDAKIYYADSNNDCSIESMCITDIYHELYDSVLAELSSRS